MAAPRMFEALRVPRFRRIFAGQTVSMLGDWLDYVAVLSVVAYTWHKGAGGLAAVAVCGALPWVVVSPLSGVLADRLPARTVMVGCDLARAAIVLGYLVAGDIYVLLGLLVLKTSFSTLFNPTQSSAVRRVVPEESLLSANTLTTFASQATKIVGPGLSGVLLATVGAHGAFVADSVSFLLSAVILSGLRVEPAEPAAAEDGAKPRMRTEMAAGLRYIVGHRVLTAAVLGMAATVFLVFTFDTLTPLALGNMGYGPEMLGEWLACVGVGAVVGTVLIGQWGGGIAPLRLMGGSQAVVGLGVAAIGLTVQHTHHPPVAALLLVPLAVGFAASGLLIAYPVILQTSTPARLMGRVMAFAGILPTVLQLAAPAVGAALADAFDVGAVFTAAGLCIVVVGVAVLAQRVGTGGADADAETAETEATAGIETAAATEAAVGIGTAGGAAGVSGVADDVLAHGAESEVEHGPPVASGPAP